MIENLPPNNQQSTIFDEAELESLSQQHTLATTGQRFLNWLLDSIFITVINQIFVYFVANRLQFFRELFFDGQEGSVGLMGIVLGQFYIQIAISAFYYIFTELQFGKTPAKFLTRTRVINDEGHDPSLKQAFIRWIVRFLPLLNVLDMFSFLFSENARGWHDQWSKTYVVKEK